MSNPDVCSSICSVCDDELNSSDCTLRICKKGATGINASSIKIGLKLGSMAEISLHASSILKKQNMTEFLEMNFGSFCGSMVLMVTCYAPLHHSTADRRFVFG